jgi:lysophospholipase L1-like esterase
LRRLLFLLAALPGPLVTARAADLPPFEWKDGDRVVLIGDALIEREQKYGYLETLITIQNPDKAITFRNLGWSGDTVRGIARAGFGKPEEGFRHLKDHVLALKPTVIFVGYGMTDSFDGEDGLPRFKEGMNRLLDVLAETKARLVLLSPIAHEDLGRPLPEPDRHNQSLRRFRDSISDIANERGPRFIDLYEAFEPVSARSHPLAVVASPHHTDDGIHLNERGYGRFAYGVNLALGDHLVHSAVFGPDGKLRASENTTITKIEASPRGLRFEMTNRYLPRPLIPDDSAGKEKRGPSWLCFEFDGLPDGRYILSIDGRPVAKADAEKWAKTLVTYTPGPEDDQTERLRQAIIEKNRLYFYRWRPQNETYLFGFRKHEQGNNAREIPLFDPLVDEKEKEIARLKVPVTHVYELVREGEEAK